MEKTWKRFLSCVIALVLLIFLLAKATDVAQRKASDIKYAPFFEHAKDFDVLFMGTSHVMNAVFPMELWDEYGITSYNFGGHGNMIATTYWVLMNALDYAEPKVVVVDCLGLYRQLKTTTNYSYVHISFDAFPLSITKIKAAYDLLDDPEIEKRISSGSLVEAEKRTELGLLWDYSVYHSRWKELGREDFDVPESLEYGAQSRIGMAVPGDMIDNPGTILKEETVAIQYLKKMIEECQKRDITILLTYLPYPISATVNWEEANTAQKIAEEYGVDFINFLDEDVVDFSVDLYDSDSHVNPSGAWKITDFFGNYLNERYHVEDHRNDERYRYWDEDYKTYAKMKDERLEKQTDLDTYLMLLADDDYGYFMNIGKPSVFADVRLLRLLEYKGVDISAISEETQYILVCGKDTLVLNSEFEPGEYGEWSIRDVGGNEYGIYKNNEEKFIIGADSLVKTEGAVIISAFRPDDFRNTVNTSVFEK